jgi:hypothetical protein
MGVPIPKLSDKALIDEYYHWNEKIKNATSWGAALAVADEFRKMCKSEMQRRGLPVGDEE